MKKFNTKVLAYAGVLIAMNVVLTRIVAIPIGPTLRITVGSVPIILGSLWFGPLVGGICGGAGDLIGCLISGYAPNPFIMCSSVLTGVLPFVFKRFFIKDLASMGSKEERTGSGFGKVVSDVFGKGFLKVLLVLAFMSLITSQGFTTYGLHLLYGMPIGPLFLSRLPQTIFLTISNSILTILIYGSPVTGFIKNSIRSIPLGRVSKRI
ncbi:MAG: folate family ECF transporter S component [Hespellia sp.]|nr:folate family ECF transporter S component [Hespellia sp.]